MGMSNASTRLGFAVFFVALLAGCGGGGTDSETTPVGDSGDSRHRPPPKPLTCAQLTGMTIPASSIGLPTSGATVTSAAVVAASGTGAAAIPEHCLVNGKISPVDTTAPDILFRVALPTFWNNKVVMFGGGGFNGTIPNVAGNVPAGPSDQLRPLGRGYATFASDSGHQANALGSLDGSFGLNDEAIRNWSGEALKKTRDASVFLIKARYATDSIRKAYFAGGSTGGREALESITRWPDDWDGAIAWYPGLEAGLGHPRRPRASSRALAKPGAYPASAAKRELLFNAAMEACDGLDGAMDGLINNQLRCNAIFDPATASVERQSAALPGRRGHRRHLPVGRADRGAESAQLRHPLQLRTGQRRERLPGLQHVGRRPGHHHAHRRRWSRPSPSWRSARRSRRCRCRRPRPTSAR